MKTIRNNIILFFVLIGALMLSGGCTWQSGAKQPLTIVQLCDPQLGFNKDGFEADLERLNRAIVKINRMKPDIVLVAGDFVHHRSDSTNSVFKEAISKVTVPVMLTPGNHDIAEPVTEEGLTLYRAFFGDDFQTLVLKGRMIISANSLLWRDAPEEETKAQNNKMHVALQEAKRKGMPVVMLTHVPPFDKTLDERDEYFNLPQSCREDILKLFDEHGVIIWLAGHTHKTSENHYGNVTILNGEGTSRNFDNHPHGFRLITLMPDKTFTWEFVDLE